MEVYKTPKRSELDQPSFLIVPPLIRYPIPSQEAGNAPVTPLWSRASMGGVVESLLRAILFQSEELELKAVHASPARLEGCQRPSRQFACNIHDRQRAPSPYMGRVV
ncbi:hypothetical protein EVAR_19824_1 [Eumeta japonica]|uniref:Uncharacterized protein n=1 Tax=Eumeta variegata TaxID=151549 RepID=A0A4C1UQR1_EUMVA|nr:hypothetical protein EVAR_19824_1 [Eumeta japonica]